MDIQRAVQDIELQAAEESHYGDYLDHDAPQEVGLDLPRLGGDHHQQRGVHDE